jgi:uncharacterized protein with HEPN domain
MSRDKQRLPDYLQHILDAIDRIGRYTVNMDKAAFKANELVCDAVIRNVDIIGEASNNVDKHYRDFAEAHPELPWTDAYEMRNAVAHGYFNVDLDIVWNTVCNDLPGLHRTVETLLLKLKSGD